MTKQVERYLSYEMDTLIFENFFLIEYYFYSNIKDFIQIIRALFIELLKNDCINRLFESTSHW